MNTTKETRSSPRGFTMLEMLVAVIASTFLLAGLGSVMFIARQVAYSPTAAARRAKTADIINQISDELRYATVITQQTSQILEFIVADRDNDGTSEKIRYEWSGVAGDPLVKTVNGGTSVAVLTSVYAFNVTVQQNAKTTTLTTTTDSAEAILQSNTSIAGLKDRDISDVSYSAQIVTPGFFSSVPANATCWNITKVDFYGKQSGGASTQVVQVSVRNSGDPLDTPTSGILGSVSIPKSSLTTGDNWNTATFATPVRNLTFSRDYIIAWTGNASSTCRLRPSDNAAGGVYESEDSGASWQYMSARQIFHRIYGTYTTPGPSYNVTRNYVSSIRLALQSGNQSSSRIDASIPLRNSPELLAAFWRTDFDRNPATTNTNGDSTADWAVTGGGSFDTTKLVNGIWTATGAIETRPLNDFTTTTTVDVRCRNTTVGGNGAVIAIYADRQGGQYAPILVYLQRQSDGTQTLTLNGKTSDTTTQQLFTKNRLSGNFVRFRLTIVPQYDVVNIQINDEDQGTYTYPRYAPTSTADRYLTLYADTSSAEFDYVDLRSGIN
jgi:prepilin-type N-terminal cleavage/methylation domain-containing protein